MGLSFSPLPGQSSFGVVCHGLTPDMIDDPTVRKQLYDLWVDKGMIVFKDLDGLDTQMRLSEVFGESEEHPLLIGRDDFAREDKVSVKINEEAGGIYQATFLYNPIMSASAVSIARLIGQEAGFAELREPGVPSKIILPATQVTKENVDKVYDLAY